MAPWHGGGGGGSTNALATHVDTLHVVSVAVTTPSLEIEAIRHIFQRGFWRKTRATSFDALEPRVTSPQKSGRDVDREWSTVGGCKKSIKSLHCPACPTSLATPHASQFHKYKYEQHSH